MMISNKKYGEGQLLYKNNKCRYLQRDSHVKRRFIANKSKNKNKYLDSYNSFNVGRGAINRGNNNLTKCLKE